MPTNIRPSQNLNALRAASRNRRTWADALHLPARRRRHRHDWAASIVIAGLLAFPPCNAAAQLDDDTDLSDLSSLDALIQLIEPPVPPSPGETPICQCPRNTITKPVGADCVPDECLVSLSYPDCYESNGRCLLGPFAHKPIAVLATPEECAEITFERQPVPDSCSYDAKHNCVGSGWHWEPAPIAAPSIPREGHDGYIWRDRCGSKLRPADPVDLSASAKTYCAQSACGWFWVTHDTYCRKNYRVINDRREPAPGVQPDSKKECVAFPALISTPSDGSQSDAGEILKLPEQ